MKVLRDKTAVGAMVIADMSCKCNRVANGRVLSSGNGQGKGMLVKPSGNQ